MKTIFYFFYFLILPEIIIAENIHSSASNAESTIILSDTLHVSDFSSGVKILEDRDSKYSFEEIKSGRLDSMFSENVIAKTGEWDRYVWARIILKSSSDNRTNWIIKTSNYYSEVRCFTVYTNGKTTLQESGWLVPLKERSIQEPSVIFNLTVNSNEKVIVYFQIHADLRWTAFRSVEMEIKPLSFWQTAERNQWLIQGLYAGLCLLCILFWLINYVNSLRKNYLYMIFSTLCMSIYILDLNGVTTSLFWPQYPFYYFSTKGQILILLPLAFMSVVFLGLRILQIRKNFPGLTGLWLILSTTTAFSTAVCSLFMRWEMNVIVSGLLMLSWFFFVTGISIISLIRKNKGPKSSLAATTPFFIGFAINAVSGYGWRPGNQALLYIIQSGCAIFTMTILFSMAFYLNNLRKKRAREQKEKELLIVNQNIMLEQKVEERTRELKGTQDILIQQEKLASLGLMTSGIAHEIQNPLNFVNNFSALSKELLAELIGSNSETEKKEVFQMLDENLSKIEHHGKRADSIVKGMLMHSRSGDFKKEQIDINILCEEAVNLAYHSIRAKIPGFDCKIETVFEDNLPQINIISQDISRVIINLMNNAFYAVREIKHSPKIIITTEKYDHSILISVVDNGKGVPEDIKDKIFQPFFTTKAAGEGTGLGLSISYDIVRTHGGEITINNLNGAVFRVRLPVT